MQPLELARLPLLSLRFFSCIQICALIFFISIMVSSAFARKLLSRAPEKRARQHEHAPHARAQDLGAMFLNQIEGLLYQ